MQIFLDIHTHPLSYPLFRMNIFNTFTDAAASLACVAFDAETE